MLSNICNIFKIPTSIQFVISGNIPDTQNVNENDEKYAYIGVNL